MMATTVRSVKAAIQLSAIGKKANPTIKLKVPGCLIKVNGPFR